MSRSFWKGPIKNNNSSLRNITITPELINQTVEVHNGKQIKTLTIDSKFLGEKIGKFIPSKIFIAHKKKAIKQRQKQKK